MNHSTDKAIPAGAPDPDELLAQFEAVMYRLARVMSAQPDGVGTHLSPPQYLVMRLLQRMGPMRVSDVAAEMGVKNPAASMMLNAMYEHGLVTREPDPDDRRATLMSVSTEGEAALHLAEQSRKVFMSRVTKNLDRDDWATVIRGLNEIADAASAELGVNGVSGAGDEHADENDS